MVTLLLALLRILGQILEHPRQHIHDAAECILSFNDAFCADAPFCAKDIGATRTFER